MNTDAEGRMLLADALSYAKKYDPKLVIDLATLTGSAVAAIGNYGFVSMHKDAHDEHENLKKVGLKVHERLAEFPFWDDYDELIKSDIADIKNLGGPYAGAITAGKFLSHFIDFPWIHIDLSCVYSKSAQNKIFIDGEFNNINMYNGYGDKVYSTESKNEINNEN